MFSFTSQPDFPPPPASRQAPSSDTHTFNMHQRLVGLAILNVTMDSVSGTRTVSVRGPPNAAIAPPGMYMLFLLNGDIYGPAKWIKVL